METGVLRKIVFLKKIYKVFSLWTWLIVVMVFAASITILIPPINSKFFCMLVVPFILSVGIFLRGKFIFSFSNKLPDSNLGYLFLYFLFFMLELGYIPKIVHIYPPNDTVNYSIVATGIILFNNLGDLFFRKIKKEYWKHKVLIEKAKKYDEAAKLMNDLVKKIRH